MRALPIKADTSWIPEFRAKYEAWFPAALPLLRAHQYAAAFKTYPFPAFGGTPWTPLATPLGRACLGVVTTAGVYRRRVDAPFQDCQADGATFLAMLRAEGLRLATDRMAYYAHWITPEERPIRYATRFFVAAAFHDVTPEPDGVEVVGWRWLPPATALTQHRASEITLPFPTERILKSLAAHLTVAALLDAARLRKIRPIRPRITLAESLIGCGRQGRAHVTTSRAIPHAGTSAATPRSQYVVRRSARADS